MYSASFGVPFSLCFNVQLRIVQHLFALYNVYAKLICIYTRKAAITGVIEGVKIRKYDSNLRLGSKKVITF
tara:strand:+ start:279 stop:491 length:213 start_codon:yes stop_codon:yes gene_type:complete